jgi:hypothetical protein
MLGKLTMPACHVCCDAYEQGSPLPAPVVALKKTALTCEEVFSFLNTNYEHYMCGDAARAASEARGAAVSKFPAGISDRARGRMREFDNALARIITSGKGLFKLQPYITCRCGAGPSKRTILLCVSTVLSYVPRESAKGVAIMHSAEEEPSGAMEMEMETEMVAKTNAPSHRGFYDMFQSITSPSVYARVKN